MFRTLLHSGILKDIYGWFFLFPVLILSIFSISIFLDPHTVVKLGILYWEDFFHHTVVAPPTRSEKLRPYIREMCPLWGGWGNGSNAFFFFGKLTFFTWKKPEIFQPQEIRRDSELGVLVVDRLMVCYPGVGYLYEKDSLTPKASLVADLLYYPMHPKNIYFTQIRDFPRKDVIHTRKLGLFLNILWFHMCFSIAQSPVRFCCNSSWGIPGWAGQNAVNSELPVDGENYTNNSQLEAVFDVNLKKTIMPWWHQLRDIDAKYLASKVDDNLPWVPSCLYI